MRKKDIFAPEFEELLNENFEEIEVENTDKEEDKVVLPIHCDNWTITDAFNAINEELPKSQLGDKLFTKCSEAFEYLSQQLAIRPIQCVVVAMLVEEGRPMSFRQMGSTLGLSRLSMMTHFNDIEELTSKRWLRHCGARERNVIYDGYTLTRGVVSAIRENRPFVPESLKCKDTQTFVEKLGAHFTNGPGDDSEEFKDEKMWIKEIVETNKHLPICKVALRLKDIESMALFMVTVADYCNFCNLDEEGINAHDIQIVYTRENTPNVRMIMNQMQHGTHQLFRKGLIEHKCEDGMADVNIYRITSYVKNEVLKDFTPLCHISQQNNRRMNGMKSYKDITPKTLFYNKAEEAQVKRLQNLLSQEQLPHVQSRLKEKGMRTGVCVLLHGAPGTGKTATAYELARLTGRDIIQVQVTDFKDKYVGESEAKLKSIFNNYRSLCQNRDTVPILLFNEGDAILSKRTTNVERSVDQMSNALQNILLEEMENMEGIMIVTTNLTCNLDKAFERRFIFKIQFDNPGMEIKANIWKSMLDNLDDNASLELAKMFDVSGGEIENIARKATMEYILTGNNPDINMIKEFAKEEKLQTNKTKPIVGFNQL